MKRKKEEMEGGKEKRREGERKEKIGKVVSLPTECKYQEIRL